MALRPVFEIYNKPPYFKKRNTEFEYFGGFAEIQKRRCVNSLHSSYLQLFPDRRILEISSVSEERTGVMLSAFNLTFVRSDGSECSVESAFQAGKCFEHGGPYTDILYMTSREAKKDPRLRNSGSVIGFSYEGELFPIEPKTLFYDWLYINALNAHKEYHKELMGYHAFTDIMFNPSKMINCQAEAAAIFVSLYSRGLLEEALRSKEDFSRIVFGTGTDDEPEQLSLFS